MTFSALVLSTVLTVGVQTDSAAPSIATLIEQTGSPGGASLRDCGTGVDIATAGVRIAGQSAAITPEDLWHLGSNTKAMTATLAARLVEADLIDWSTTIGDALSELDLDIHEQLASVTLAELLQHRGGVMGNAGLMTTLRLMGADAERDLRADRLVYASAVLKEPAGPQGDFLYSNAGYVIAGLMMEEMAGEPYELLMAREMFEPLSMASAGWGPPGVQGEADQPRGHRPGVFGGLNAREPGSSADNPPAMNAAGRAHMSLQDLTRFLSAHLQRNGEYLTAESWERLQTAPDGADYALGWGVRSSGTLTHSGSNTMWFVQMAIAPDDGCLGVVAVNDGRIDEVSGPVSQLIGDLIAPDEAR